MNFQPRDLSLGTLEVVEIYDYFDEPLFCACMNEREQRFVVLLAASNTDSKTWLYAPVSPGRLSALRDGKLPTYDVFRGVEAGAIFRATWRRTDRTWDATWVEAASVPDEMLPDPGVLLELEPEEDTDKIPDVDRLSHQLRRDVVAIRIKLPNRNDHEAPASLVGPVITSLQQTLNSISQFTLARPTDRAPIPAKVLEKVQFDVASTFPGSFGIELHAHFPADLFGESPVVAVVEQLIKLIEATKDAAALRAKLAELSGRLPSKYRDLLNALAAVETVDVSWGSPKAGAGGRASLTKAHVMGGLTVLGTLDRREPQQYTVVARLIGINVRTKAYELYDEVEHVKYSGRVDDAAMGAASTATVNRVYSALIRETEEVGPSGETEAKYRLLALDAGDSDEPPAAETLP